MIRWGIIGPGAIAASFAESMGYVVGGEVTAIASRSMERAVAFGERFGIAGRYTTTEELAAAPDVDAVYVATPHSRHEADTLAALEGGKHVLCEKPFALNAQQALRMATAAQERGLFLMEAIWSRFLPAYRTLADLLAEERIGRPRLVEADFGFHMAFDPSHRLFDPALGGGALLDLGIYPVQLCSFVLGPIEHIVADGVLGASGVDELVSAVLRHANGGLGVVKASSRIGLACTARISGTDGWIDLPAFMHCPGSVSVTARGKSEVIEAGFPGGGLQFETMEAQRCINAGLGESPLIPLTESVALAAALDTIRAQVGVVYPAERETG